MGVKEAVKAALEPYVGPTVADTCVRATALSLGKTTDDLSFSDLHALEARVHSLLAPIAPPKAIDDVVAEIRRAAQGEV